MPEGGDGENFETSHFVGHDRQRATVRTATHAARKAEAEDHVLLSAVDAARSP
jgi:23S rRNA G2445 N2-methylase RlmL